MSTGRPTKYKESFAGQAYRFCASHGFTHQDLADLFSVNKDTITEWINRHEEFSVSLKKGKDEYDSEEVEKSLLRRALGYEFVETTKEISPKADPETGGEQLRITKTVTKQMAPDVTAHIFWLKNRQPDRWRDRTDLQIGGTLTVIAPTVNKPKDAGT